MERLLAQPIAIGRQSALETSGPAAREIGVLWNVMLGVSGVITLGVLLMLAYAIWRRRPAHALPEADRAPDPRGEALNDESGGRGHEGEGRPRSERTGVRIMIGGGFVLPTIVCGALLVYVLVVLARVSMPSHALAQFDQLPEPGELVVQVTGRQYWWEVEYLDRDPQLRFETANEIRIPVGRPVHVRLASNDVIHSFWVPSLQGKMDLIPGRMNVVRIQADEPGVYRGQCAEYCGVQHAKMALVVVAQPEGEWQRWMTAQRAPARMPPPADTMAARDRAAFLGSGCVLCHAVRGTAARGEMGPDLTHLASRLTLAAGTLPNTPGHRYGWITNPQAIKPGSHMPAVPMSATELHAIARYLATLK